MKKIIALLLSAALLLSFCGCSDKESSSDTDTSSAATVSTSAYPPEADTDSDYEIDVEVVGTVTGSGTVVQSVKVDKSGATVIGISKDSGSSGSSSSSSSGSSSTGSAGTEEADPLAQLGLDFVLNFDNSDITILQLTDFRVIDSAQQRTLGALNAQFTEMYKPENIDSLLFDYIESAIKAAKPDLILVSGNMVQGQFDDLGNSFKKVVEYLDSFKIFWAPVFGDLDNISAQGAEWQSSQLENAKYCLFNRNNSVGGNSNYTIGIGIKGTLSRVIYMLDSNGCKNSSDPSVSSANGITQKQLTWLTDKAASVADKNGSAVPAFACFSMPSADVKNALIAAGYETADTSTATYKIGTDVTAKNGDSGTKGAAINDTHAIGALTETFKGVGIDGVFMGDNPGCDISVLCDGIRWTIGRKTGKYDTNYSLNGGTKIELSNNAKGFTVSTVG